MRVRHSGFALILVLVAVAALFSLAVFAGAMSRTTTLEVAATHHHDAAHRGARSAAVLALAGLYTIDPQAELNSTTGSGGGGSAGGSGGGNEPEPEDALELPEPIRILLEESGAMDQLQEKIDEAKERDEAHVAAEGAGGLAGRVDGGITVEALKLGGLPTTPLLVTLGDATYRIRLSDAIGRLDINHADEATLTRFLLAHRIDERTTRRLVDQLLDWRDEDDFVRTDGAESTEYERRGVTARNGAMRSPEELLFLPAMTPDLYERIRHDITLSGDGRVHINSASREVLMSLPGVTRELADEIVAQRTQQPFKDEAAIRDFLPIAARDALDLLRTAPSTYIHLHIEQLGEGGQPRFSFEGVAAFTQRGLAGLGLRRY